MSTTLPTDSRGGSRTTASHRDWLGASDRSRCLSLLLLGALLSLAGRPSIGQETRGAADTGRAADTVQEAVVEARLERDITFLASDELRGRDVGSEGLETAAGYIAESFADAGLETRLFDGTPFQTFQIPLGVTVAEEEKNR